MPSVATTQVEHFSIDQHKLTRQFERSSSRALRYELDEDELVYESYYERRPTSGPTKSIQRRRVQPTAAETATTTAPNGSGNTRMNGFYSNHVSPQRVRLVESNEPRFGWGSQRAASHSSLAGRVPFESGSSNGTRIGRFVNYYPASRQPSPSGRRKPNPYAFHVPASHTLPAPANQRDLHYYSSQYELVGAPLQPQVESQLSSEPPTAMRQSSYGYVAPLNRVESSMKPRRFNKSLRSRTISHLPSMVQVSILEDDKQLNQSPSSKDLLKAHVVVWRSDAQLEQDNPFRPGTELSWEAELMVRLIQRGYPIDQLPKLVEAAKVEAVTRRSECKPNSRSMSHLTQPAAASKPNQIDSKAIWANSLKRAKSIPRFEENKREVDSIDRLITSIELDVIQPDRNKPEALASARAKKGLESATESIGSEKMNSSALIGKIQPPLGCSPSLPIRSSSIKERNQQHMQAVPAKPARANSQVGPAKQQTESKQMAVVKQKKRRCCLIH